MIFRLYNWSPRFRHYMTGQGFLPPNEAFASAFQAVDGGTYHPTDPRLADLWGVSSESSSGIQIDSDTAQNLSAVWAACWRIEMAMAACQFRLKDPDGELVEQHPALDILNLTPDGERSDYHWKQSGQNHLLMSGNHMGEIVRDGNGRPRQVHPLDKGRLVRTKNPRTDEPAYLDNETGVYLPPDRVFHVKGRTTDGLTGMDPLTYARESLALGTMAEIHGALFYKRGGFPQGFITIGKMLGDILKKELADEWDRWTGKLEKAFSTPILSGGADWKPMGMSHENAQFIQTRAFQTEEVARWFGISPHMLGQLDQMKYDNITQLLHEFVLFTMAPWGRCWATESTLKLLTEAERAAGYRIEANFDQFLKPDAQTRAALNEIMVKYGVLTPDEWRKEENRDPLEDDMGSHPLLLASQLDLFKNVLEGTSPLAGGGAAPEGSGTADPSQAKPSDPGDSK